MTPEEAEDLVSLKLERFKNEHLWDTGNKVGALEHVYMSVG